MDTERWERLETLFMDALDLPSHERPAFLKKVCGEDLELLAELTSMIEVEMQDDALALERRLLVEAMPAPSDPERLIGTHIGPYQLEQCIGEGGMGEVYLARRADDQFQQKVALKLVRAGYHNQQIQNRFRTERQILARLSHPNITQLLDGGVDAAGRPYIVMQYVNGIPITEYCDRHALSIDDRLELFHTVCAAVQHAHRNLVVHRDLKPSNILVTEDGVVKLLDFGIAKLLDPEWAPAIAITRSQFRLMTPEYAAPEQIKGNPITTATDVYALGVLLYEILSGRRPYQLQNQMQAEIERIICEVPPARPSTAVTEAATETGDDKTLSPEKLSQARRVGIHRLKKLLQGDLDNIVLMALRKEPTRRYSSAAQLSDDIERYRNGLPVHAQKDSVPYRVSKFIRRHRILVGVTSIFFVILIGFTLFTAYQSRLLKTERDTARIEKDRAEQVIGLLVDLFETANPAIAPGGDTLRVREFIKQGTEKILEEIKDDEALSIQLKHTVGQMYAAQGQYQEARQLYQEAYDLQEAHYGKDDTTTTAYLYDLAVQTWRLGDIEASRPMFHDLLERHTRIYGPEHPKVAASLLVLSLVTDAREEKFKLLESSLSMRRKLLPAHHMDIAESLNQLAIYYIEENNWHEAARLFQESLDILEETLPHNHPNVLAVMNNLATSLNKSDQSEEAITIQRQVIDRLEGVVSDSSVQMSNAHNNLAVLLTNEGNFEEAQVIFRKVLGIQEYLLGASHARVTNTKRNLAIALSYLGRTEESVQLMAEALAMLRSKEVEAGADATGEYQALYALLLHDAGQLDEAYVNARQALDLLETSATAQDLQLSNARFGWGVILMSRGELQNATSYIQQARSTRESIYGPDDERVAEVQCIYGRLLALQNKPEEARALLEEALPRYAAWPRANPGWVDAANKTLDQLR